MRISLGEEEKHKEGQAVWLIAFGWAKEKRNIFSKRSPEDKTGRLA